MRGHASARLSTCSRYILAWFWASLVSEQGLEELFVISQKFLLNSAILTVLNTNKLLIGFNIAQKWSIGPTLTNFLLKKWSLIHAELTSEVTWKILRKNLLPEEKLLVGK